MSAARQKSSRIAARQAVEAARREVQQDEERRLYQTPKGQPKARSKPVASSSAKNGRRGATAAKSKSTPPPQTSTASTGRRKAVKRKRASRPWDGSDDDERPDYDSHSDQNDSEESDFDIASLEDESNSDEEVDFAPSSAAATDDDYFAGVEEFGDESRDGVFEDAPKLELPPSSTDLLIENDDLLRVLEIYDVLFSYSRLLQLTAFYLEDFCAALRADENSPLLAAVHIALFRALLRDEDEEHVTFASTDTNTAHNLYMSALDHMTYAELLRWYADADARTPPAAVRVLAANDYPFTGLADRLDVLSWLTERFLASAEFLTLCKNEGRIVADEVCRDCGKAGMLVDCGACSLAFHLDCGGDAEPAVGVLPNQTSVDKMEESEDEPTTTTTMATNGHDRKSHQQWYCRMCTHNMKIRGAISEVADQQRKRLTLRKTPIGSDRHGRLYYVLARRLFVIDPATASLHYYSTWPFLYRVATRLDAARWERYLCAQLFQRLDELQRDVRETVLEVRRRKLLPGLRNSSAPSYFDLTNLDVLGELIVAVQSEVASNGGGDNTATTQQRASPTLSHAAGKGRKRAALTSLDDLHAEDEENDVKDAWSSLCSLPSTASGAMALDSLWWLDVRAASAEALAARWRLVLRRWRRSLGVGADAQLRHNEFSMDMGENDLSLHHQMWTNGDAAMLLGMQLQAYKLGDQDASYRKYANLYDTYDFTKSASVRVKERQKRQYMGVRFSLTDDVDFKGWPAESAGKLIDDPTTQSGTATVLRLAVANLLNRLPSGLMHRMWVPVIESFGLDLCRATQAHDLACILLRVERAIRRPCFHNAWWSGLGLVRLHRVTEADREAKQRAEATRKKEERDLSFANPAAEDDEDNDVVWVHYTRMPNFHRNQLWRQRGEAFRLNGRGALGGWLWLAATRKLQALPDQEAIAKKRTRLATLTDRLVDWHKSVVVRAERAERERRQQAAPACWTPGCRARLPFTRLPAEDEAAQTSSSSSDSNRGALSLCYSAQCRERQLLPYKYTETPLAERSHAKPPNWRAPAADPRLGKEKEWPLPLPQRFEAGGKRSGATTAAETRRSMLVLPQIYLRRLARQGGLQDATYVPGFSRTGKANLQIWPLPCNRPHVDLCWRWLTTKARSMQAVALQLRVLHTAIRWADLEKSEDEESYKGNVQRLDDRDELRVVVGHIEHRPDGAYEQYECDVHVFSLNADDDDDESTSYGSRRSSRAAAGRRLGIDTLLSGGRPTRVDRRTVDGVELKLWEIEEYWVRRAQQQEREAELRRLQEEQQNPRKQPQPQSSSSSTFTVHGRAATTLQATSQQKPRGARRVTMMTATPAAVTRTFTPMQQQQSPHPTWRLSTQPFYFPQPASGMTLHERRQMLMAFSRQPSPVTPQQQWQQQTPHMHSPHEQHLPIKGPQQPHQQQQQQPQPPGL